LTWTPSAEISTLRSRSHLIQKIRQFFQQHDYLEVETPVLGTHTVTDLYIDSFATTPADQTPSQYLQTSPEFYMKRLLAHESGPIYQIGKAFRQEDAGKQHNPEFTMLECYNPGFDHHAMMQRIDELMQFILQTPAAKRVTYLDLFQRHLKINPHTATAGAIKDKIKQQDINIDSTDLNRDTCLQLLLSHCIEPTLGEHAPIFIYDFPISQAALAKISQSEPPVAERFELYYRGTELANGFHELTDPQEQQQRFQKDLKLRAELEKEIPSIDQKFIDCLQHMPACAGVAIGLDRLIMLALNKSHIKDVISFAWQQR
jgi:elongation factor P--(R)-beta-lysine ligase